MLRARYYVNPLDTPDDIRAYAGRLDPVVKTCDGEAVKNDRVPRGVIITVLEEVDECPSIPAS